MLNIALRAARKASAILAQAFERPDLLKVDIKENNSYVTQIDRSSEYAIIETLQKTYPSHSFQGEETGFQEGSGEDKAFTWMIDPLDGTTNFINGIPYFSISIACLYKDRLEHAIILDPLRNEEFIASRGDGARLNGRRLRVSNKNSLEHAVLSTGYPISENQNLSIERYFKVLASLTKKTVGIRGCGSAALDLAYVAAGRFDGLWMSGLQAHDIAAGMLLVTESGGLTSDFDGESNSLKNGHIIAATPKCFREVLEEFHRIV